MKKETKQIINDYYSEIDTPTELKEIFENVLVRFIEFHNFQQGEYDTLFCNIHTNFPERHNCVACNLNDSNKRIEEFLLGYRLFRSTYSTITNFIFLLYLQVECIFEYLSIIQLPESYIMKNFQILYSIKRWANFLKHPKSFMLVHHPIWEYSKEVNIFENKKKPIIDTKFVNIYYSGESKNKELFKLLENKEDIIVLFPNPLDLITDFCEAQKKFADLISMNQVVREILNKATLAEFYESNADELK
jgi:hypothetical protein